MTLVLSMNPFLDTEGDPPPSTYPPLWESERYSKACLSATAPARGTEEQFTRDPHCRRAPDHISVSRIAYFKRKFVDEDESPFSFRTYCHTVAPVLEERAHVLRLSLEKMRFIDDPELFLRRSVLVNNLLRRLRAEIILQSSDWCLPASPAFPASPCLLPTASGPAHQLLHRAAPSRVCLTPPTGPPLRKRFRMLRAQAEVRPDVAQTCCCIYAAAAAAAAAGHYIHFPFSMYEAALSSCQPAQHSTSLFQLAGHSKLTMAVDDLEDEDEEAEEEENEEEEHRVEEEEDIEEEQELSGPSDRDKESHKSVSMGHKLIRTEVSCSGSSSEEQREDPEEDEGEEEEEDGKVVRPCLWSSDKESHKFSFWRRKAHRQ